MTKKTATFIIYLVGIILVIAIAYFGYSYLTEHYTPETPDVPQTEKDPNRKTAPDFTVTDQNGNPVSLSDFQGKPVILNFWATWCGPCKSEMPAFDSIYQKYGDDIHFLMVNMQEDPDSVSAFLAENGYTFPVYLDPNSDAATAYGVYSIPATALISADGIFLTGFVGATNEKALERMIETNFGGTVQ